jgi:hypothetical protein
MPNRAICAGRRLALPAKPTRRFGDPALVVEFGNVAGLDCRQSLA